MTTTVSTPRRLLRFNAVGVLGFLVQLVALSLLVKVAEVPVLVATAAAVELAVLFNFACHVQWTWSDRPAPPRATVGRLVRFNLSNGLVSVVVNVGLMALLQRGLGIHYVIANVAGVLCAAVVNFLFGNWFVFVDARRPPSLAPRSHSFRAVRRAGRFATHP